MPDQSINRTDVFDYATDTGLINRRPLIRHGTALPDGLTVDWRRGGAHRPTTRPAPPGLSP